MPNVGSKRDALKLYKKWYGKAQVSTELITEVTNFPKSWVYLGRVKNFGYYTDRITSKNPKGDKEVGYSHEWKNDNYLPFMFADPYGRFIIIYGNLDIKEEGVTSEKDIPSSFNRTTRQFEEQVQKL